MLESTLHFLSEHPEYLLLSVFIVALCESLAVVGIIVPGVGLITAISVLAGNQQLPLFLFVVSAILGAFLGDLISYTLGRMCQPYLPRIWPFKQHPNWLFDGQQFFQHHGGKSIFIGRFIGPIRPFIPMVAGMMNMQWAHFLLLNLLSAVAWGAAYLLPGYYLGEQLDIKWLLSWEGMFGLILMTAIALGTSYLIGRKKEKRP